VVRGKNIKIKYKHEKGKRRSIVKKGLERE